MTAVTLVAARMAQHYTARARACLKNVRCGVLRSRFRGSFRSHPSLAASNSAQPHILSAVLRDPPGATINQRNRNSFTTLLGLITRIQMRAGARIMVPRQRRGRSPASAKPRRAYGMPPVSPVSPSKVGVQRSDQCCDARWGSFAEDSLFLTLTDVSRRCTVHPTIGCHAHPAS